jgi:hypothetical protein
MEIIEFKKDGSKWIKIDHQVDYYHNLNDYENWLMDTSLHFHSSVKSMTGISMELENAQHEYNTKKKLEVV